MEISGDFLTVHIIVPNEKFTQICNKAHFIVICSYCEYEHRTFLPPSHSTAIPFKRLFNSALFYLLDFFLLTFIQSDFQRKKVDNHRPSIFHRNGFCTVVVIIIAFFVAQITKRNIYRIICVCMRACMRVIYVVPKPNHRKTEKEVHLYTRLSLDFAQNLRIF